MKVFLVIVGVIVFVTIVCYLVYLLAQTTSTAAKRPRISTRRSDGRKKSDPPK